MFRLLQSLFFLTHQYSRSGRPSRFIVFFCCLTLSVFALTNAAHAGRTLTVGVYENPPKVFIAEGKPSGIFVEIIEHIARQEGWNLRYVPGTWAEGLERLQKGEIDVMTDVAYTTEREDIFRFHKLPVLTSGHRCTLGRTAASSQSSTLTASGWRPWNRRYNWRPSNG